MDKMVVVDYLDRIEDNSFENLQLIFQELKEFAMSYKVSIVIKKHDDSFLIKNGLSDFESGFQRGKLNIILGKSNSSWSKLNDTIISFN